MSPGQVHHHSRPATLSVWLGFAMMCIGMFMAILDVQVVATSMPTIQHALDIPQDQMSWIQTAYLIAEIVAIPLTGFLTRTLSTRRLFVIAVLMFSAASVGCAFSPGFGTLILWRVIQGFFGGTLIPSVFAAVFLLFPVRSQTLATTVAGILAVVAPTVGPVVGGWITVTYSWPWLFLINVLPGIIAGGVAWRSLPRELIDYDQARHIDVVSLTLLIASLSALEIGIKEAPQRSWTSPLVMGLLALSIVAGVEFVRRMIRAAQPLINLRILAERNFAVGCVLSFAMGIALFGSVYLMPLFLAYVRQHGALEVGRIMLVTGVVQFAMAPVAVALEQRFDERYLTVLGFLLFGAGLALSSVQTNATDYDEMFWPQVVRGAAMMLCILAPTRLALGQIAKTSIPDASGLFNMMRNLGGAIGIAIIDTVVYTRAPIYAHRLGDRLAAGDATVLTTLGVPPDTAAAALLDPAAWAALAPLVDRTAFAQAINDAWALIALITIAAVVCVPLSKAPIWRLIVSIRNGRVFVQHERT